jgi:phosphoglycolate phosphatase
MIHSVVFDLDGTLLDSAPDILEELGRALAAAGVEGAVRFTRADIGPPIAEMLARAGVPLDEAQLRNVVGAFRERYDVSTYPGTRPFDGAGECVAALRARGVTLGVATNKPAVPTRRLLDRWFPGAFADCVCVDSLPDRRLSKEEMLRELSRRHGLAPAASIMVGDAASDLRAGRALGWRTVAALYGYGDAASLHAEAPDWSIRSIPELLPLLEGG